MCTLSTCWHYYQSLVLSKKSRHSQASEAARWRHLLRHFGPDYKISDIQTLDLIKFQDTIKHLSPQSIAHCLSLLRRVINYSIFIGIYDGTCPKITMPKFDNKRLRFLSREEAKNLLAELKKKSELWHDITLVALNTGMRAGEIFNLTSECFDKKNRVIHVMKTKNLKNRTIPLNFFAYDVLEKRDSSPFLFVNKEGHKIKYVARDFRVAVKNCALNTTQTDRLNKVVFHTLRHTFASWLVQECVPLAVVSELLGHSSINITMRYAHLAPSQGKMAVDTIAKRLTD